MPGMYFLESSTAFTNGNILLHTVIFFHPEGSMSLYETQPIIFDLLSLSSETKAVTSRSVEEKKRYDATHTPRIGN